MTEAVTLLLLASSTVSVATGGVYACSDNSFDISKFDLKTCKVTAFNKAIKRVAKDMGVTINDVRTVLGDETPIDWEFDTPETSVKTEAEIQIEKELAVKEAERERLLELPPDDIDVKPGLISGVEIINDPSWVEASPKDCWEIVKDEDEYGTVAGWGHRNANHEDPKLRNTCFIYKRKDDGTGLSAFDGDKNDKVHTTGCHKPGLKLSDGCMTKDEKDYKARMKRTPPKTIHRVNGMPVGVKSESDPSWAGMSMEDCFKLASDAGGIEAGVRAWGYHTSEHKNPALRNTCVIYRDGDFKPFKGTNDATTITGCVGPNMKVDRGCLTPEELAQEIQNNSKLQQALAMAKMAAKMAEQLAKQAAQKVARAARVAAAAVKRAAEATKRAVTQAAKEAGRRIAQAGLQAVRAAKEALRKAKQAAEYAARKAREAAEAAARAAREAALRAKRAAEEVARKAKKAAEETARKAKKAAKAAASAAKKAAKWVCFSPNTPVQLQSGELVVMKDLKLGDVLVGNVIVDATLRIKNDGDPYYKIYSKELEDYIYVTGSHYMQYGDKYIRVNSYPGAIPTEECAPVLSCLVTSNHHIPVGEYIFWDWEDNLVPQTE